VDRITNKDGMVAMKFPQPIQKHVDVPGGFYVFFPRRNISFAWIKPEHVDYLLSTQQTCCGGTRHQVFRLASQSDANIWEGISER